MAKRRLRLPRLDGGTQPREREGVFEFLKRREIDRLRKIASESMKDRQSRLQREENASRNMPPGRKGARVYYWDLVEGVRVRTAVGRNNYEDIWERYGQRQRHYDSVADEWDICTELDPNDEPSYPDDDDDDDDYFILAHSTMGEDTAHNVGTASSLAYLARLLPSSGSDERVVFDEPVDDIVVHRFGFAPDGRSTDRQYSCPEKIWNSTLLLIGCGRPPIPPIRDERTASQLCTFLHDLMKAGRLQQAPRALDLISIRPALPFEVDVLPAGTTSYFLILPPAASESEAFFLAFTHAATVMEIARRKWGPGTADIIHYLIRHGFSFNTLSPYHPLRGYDPQPQRQFPTLGVRHPGFRPGQDEYRSYEYRRDSFLRSVRGRAAILAGGIIARLARGVVDENDVFEGPTNQAIHGVCVSDPRLQVAFWDDQLTSDEEDLICGCYEV
ncbi:hypothetical protein F5051DRAFT_341597, partial [Lentinula edodes]